MRWSFWDVLEGLIGFTVIAVLLGLLGSYFYQVHLEFERSQTQAAPGDFVDLGGRQLHVICSGQSEGADLPLVLFEAPLLRGAEYWRKVMDAVPGRRQVCAYDRPGYGWSNRVSDRSADDFVTDIDNLLRVIGADGPVIMVGEGFGGLVAQRFANAHGERIAGLVLIDPYWMGAMNAGEPPAFEALLGKIRAERRMLESGLRNVLPPRAGQLSPLMETTAASDAIFLQERRTWRTAERELNSLSDLAQAVPSAGNGFPVVVLLSEAPLSGLGDAAEVRDALKAAAEGYIVRARTGRVVDVPNNSGIIGWEEPEAVADAVAILSGSQAALSKSGEDSANAEKSDMPPAGMPSAEMAPAAESTDSERRRGPDGTPYPATRPGAEGR